MGPQALGVMPERLRATTPRASGKTWKSRGQPSPPLGASADTCHSRERAHTQVTQSRFASRACPPTRLP